MDGPRNGIAYCAMFLLSALQWPEARFWTWKSSTMATTGPIFVPGRTVFPPSGFGCRIRIDERDHHLQPTPKHFSRELISEIPTGVILLWRAQTASLQEKLINQQLAHCGICHLLVVWRYSVNWGRMTHHVET
jgi:hypothetical protein